MTCKGLYEIQLRLQSKWKSSFSLSPSFLVAAVCTFCTWDVQTELKTFWKTSLKNIWKSLLRTLQNFLLKICRRVASQKSNFFYLFFSLSESLLCSELTRIAFLAILPGSTQHKDGQKTMWMNWKDLHNLPSSLIFWVWQWRSLTGQFYWCPSLLNGGSCWFHLTHCMLI